jgi:hypothetical protein
MPTDKELSEHPEVFVRITNEQVWLEIIEVKKKVESLNTKLYSFAGALVIVVAFLGLTGGITIG